MRIQLFPVENKPTEDYPDFIAMQRQRLPKGNEHTYQEVEVGVAYINEAPNGKKYIDIKLLGGNNNAPKEQ